MNLLTRSAFILLFGAVTLASQPGHANGLPAGTDTPPDQNFELAKAALADRVADDGTAVSIVYLKDSDGKPYIVSIRSEDEQVNRMVREWISGTAQELMGPGQSRDGETLAITFIYNNIR